MASGSDWAYALPSVAKDRRIYSGALRSTARTERSDPTQRRERHRRIVAAALKATLRPRSEAEFKQTMKKERRLTARTKEPECGGANDTKDFIL